jgi:hypothetical protein
MASLNSEIHPSVTRTRTTLLSEFFPPVPQTMSTLGSEIFPPIPRTQPIQVSESFPSSPADDAHGQEPRHQRNQPRPRIRLDTLPSAQTLNPPLVSSPVSISARTTSALSADYINPQGERPSTFESSQWTVTPRSLVSQSIASQRPDVAGPPTRTVPSPQVFPNNAPAGWRPGMSRREEFAAYYLWRQSQVSSFEEEYDAFLSWRQSQVGLLV